MINVVLASDENYFPGLAGTVISLGENTSEIVTVFVMDGGISKSSWQKLENYISSSLPHLSIVRIEPDLSIFEGIKSRKNRDNRKNAYVRIILDSLLPNVDKIIYIDSDIYFGKDIAELNQIDLEDKIALVVQDIGFKFLKNDCPIIEELNLDPEAMYFNSGLMVIDLQKWRNENIQSRTLELLHNYSYRFTSWDQTALNIILIDKVKYIDSDWNHHVYFPVNFEHDTLNINFHYIEKHKPWHGYPINSYYYLFQKELSKIGVSNLGFKALFYKDYYKFLGGVALRTFKLTNNEFYINILNDRRFIKSLLGKKTNDLMVNRYFK